MKNRIKLYRTADGWVCRFMGPHAGRVRRLFGSDTIPSAFTADARAGRVLAKIRELNPGYEVEIAESSWEVTA